MKKSAIIGLTLLGICIATGSASASQPNPAKVKLDPQNVSRAAQVVSRNKGLFQDREKLAALIRMSKSMQQKRIGQ
ncbi:MAG: hypothetical protein KC897_10470 [Candidatus Omnitrophica bacterium]|nr:hypothetical protein [Candidatus Omnitrophota bacterium]MCB9720922.1 hypothetical protein [Candidatus Omnitrophota bacterium]